MRYNKPKATHARPSRAYVGVSLIETIIAMLILSGAFVAVLNSVSAARATYLTTNDHSAGHALAEDMLAEILQQAYTEPGVSILGLDGTESLGPGRSQFDDLDDYEGWSASPPQTQAGDAMANLNSYTRSVEVDWVSPLSPGTIATTDQGVKRITVTVYRGEKQAAQLVAYRTETFDLAGGGE